MSEPQIHLGSRADKQRIRELEAENERLRAAERLAEAYVARSDARAAWHDHKATCPHWQDAAKTDGAACCEALLDARDATDCALFAAGAAYRAPAAGAGEGEGGKP